MKKLFYLILAFIAVLFLCIHLIIPGRVHELKKIAVHAPESAILNYLIMKKGWKKWWPNKNGIDRKDSSTFTYKGVSFKIDKSTLTEITLMVTDGDKKFPSVIRISPGNGLSNNILWSFTYSTSNNPVKRFIQFERSRELAKYSGELLGQFREFIETDENIYGIKIEYAKVQDSLVVSRKIIAEQYPDTREVYRMIEGLRSYAKHHKIEKRGLPMLNVTQSGEKEFHVTVALPVSKRAPESKDIRYKQMVLGNILVTEVRGGTHTVQQAMAQLKQYIHDNRHTSPAIPFQVLVTDRQAEPDTSRWISRLYYPIL